MVRLHTRPACYLTLFRYICLPWYLWHIKVWWPYLHRQCRHHSGTLPYPTCWVYMLCLFSQKYDDDVSTISPNPVVSPYGLGLVLLKNMQYRIYDASVLPPTLVRFLHIARAWSRFLSFCSALIPRQFFHGSPKAHCQKNISVTNCLEDTRLIWCLSNPVWEGERLRGCEHMHVVKPFVVYSCFANAFFPE